MHRTPLDLRGLSLTELQAKDAEIGDELNSLNWLMESSSWVGPRLLADRRQLREEMERRDLPSDDDETFPGPPATVPGPRVKIPVTKMPR